MAIDPLRSTGGRIIQLRERPATPAARPPAPTADAESDTARAPGLNVRKTLVLTRIQQDFYQQAHVRERIIESLLEFLDEE